MYWTRARHGAVETIRQFGSHPAHRAGAKRTGGSKRRARTTNARVIQPPNGLSISRAGCGLQTCSRPAWPPHESGQSRPLPASATSDAWDNLLDLIPIKGGLAVKKEPLANRWGRTKKRGCHDVDSPGFAEQNAARHLSSCRAREAKPDENTDDKRRLVTWHVHVPVGARLTLETATHRTSSLQNRASLCHQAKSTTHIHSRIPRRASWFTKKKEHLSRRHVTALLPLSTSPSGLPKWPDESTAP